MTQADWTEQANTLFGSNPRDWRFTCPACGFVQSIVDFERANVDEGTTQKQIAFSCVGRHIPGSRDAFDSTRPRPCNYAGGGLFKLNPVEVRFTDGKIDNFFAFATPSEIARQTKRLLDAAGDEGSGQ